MLIPAELDESPRLYDWPTSREAQHAFLFEHIGSTNLDMIRCHGLGVWTDAGDLVDVPFNPRATWLCCMGEVPVPLMGPCIVTQETADGRGGVFGLDAVWVDMTVTAIATMPLPYRLMQRFGLAPLGRKDHD